MADGTIEGCVLVFSYENTKIQLVAEQPKTGECWNHPKKDTPCLRAKEKLQQEATIRIGHGTTDWFKIGKEVYQDYILSPCLFILYAEYIMQNAG